MSEVIEMNTESGLEETQEIKQLLIDDTVTTVISSKKKGITSLVEPYKKIFSIPTRSFCEKIKLDPQMLKLDPKILN